MKIAVISGKTGVGKDTVIDYLTKNHGFSRFPSLTTRPRRTNEIHGINYQFVSERFFSKTRRSDQLLDCVCISGYYYGFPINTFMEQTEGLWALNLVAESGLAILKLFPKITYLFYLTFPDSKTQIEKLKMRGASDYEIRIRIRDDPSKDRKPAYYDCEITNKESEKTAALIAKKIKEGTDMLEKAVEEELREKNMLESGHPTQEAYRVAVNTADEHSMTVKELYEHAEACEECNRKLENALAEKSEIIRNQTS